MAKNLHVAAAAAAECIERWSSISRLVSSHSRGALFTKHAMLEWTVCVAFAFINTMHSAHTIEFLNTFMRFIIFNFSPHFLRFFCCCWWCFFFGFGCLPISLSFDWCWRAFIFVVYCVQCAHFFILPSIVVILLTTLRHFGECDSFFFLSHIRSLYAYRRRPYNAIETWAKRALTMCAVCRFWMHQCGFGVARFIHHCCLVLARMPCWPCVCLFFG